MKTVGICRGVYFESLIDARPRISHRAALSPRPVLARRPDVIPNPVAPPANGGEEPAVWSPSVLREQNGSHCLLRHRGKHRRFSLYI